ncbi:Rieske 2Fe-2S domain-containing protein [Pseudonocardia hispaniensis]|uniref:Rieske 2Fe-2S domain-containing protein n=1 Tax=Pseudonocardia hispaniensis TaxID=904933 RepID=A0ABW1J9G8_9PSEU
MAAPELTGEAGGETIEFVEVCAEDELADGEKLVVEIDDQRVMLARVAGTYYAISSICTHEHAFLDNGAIVENVVYCPLHYSAFDLRTGCVLGPPADKPTPTFGVRVENGTVLVSVKPVAVTEPEPDPDIRVEPVEVPSTLQSRILDRFDSMSWLQRAAAWTIKIGTPIRATLAPRGVLDLLHGRWLGHALHPALSDVPIGLWGASVLLYVFGQTWPAVLLSLAGIASAVPTIATGVADLLVTDGHDRRMGTLHGILMSLATLVQIASPVAYFLGSPLVAGILAAVSFVITIGGAFFGGHLVLGRGHMVDHTVWPVVTPQWQRAVQESELIPGGTAVAEVDGRKVLLYRSPEDDRISAIEDACSHGSGPLSLGKVCDGIVTCPWHDSKFRLRDGAVVRGPATFPQPVLEVRITGGWIEVRPPASRPEGR